MGAAPEPADARGAAPEAADSRATAPEAAAVPAILSTRPAGEADPLTARLRQAGLRVYAVPTVAVAPADFEVPDLAAYDWVVLTSVAGVRALLERASPPGGGTRWAAVGPRTAAELERRGVRVDAVPALSRGARVAAAMAELGPLAGRRVLLARADAAADDLPRALRAAGAIADELTVYRTQPAPEASRPALNRALRDPALKAVVFASGSAVLGLLRLADDDARQVPAVTIGPATTEVARREGFRVAGQAERPDVASLAAAVLAALD